MTTASTLRVVVQIRGNSRDLDARIAPLRLRETLLPRIAYHPHDGVFAVGEIANEVRPPVAVADHTNPNHYCLTLFGFARAPVPAPRRRSLQARRPW